jgi:hypothetical protein
MQEQEQEQEQEQDNILIDIRRCCLHNKSFSGRLIKNGIGCNLVGVAVPIRGFCATADAKDPRQYIGRVFVKDKLLFGKQSVPGNLRVPSENSTTDNDDHVYCDEESDKDHDRKGHQNEYNQALTTTTSTTIVAVALGCRRTQVSAIATVAIAAIATVAIADTTTTFATPSAATVVLAQTIVVDETAHTTPV